MAKVEVYTTSYCPFCVRAKTLLKGKGIDFKEINMDGKDQELKALKAKTGLMTVPQIFINDELIGGYSDLADLDSKGELDPLLK